jgi:maleate isomerase
MLTIPSYSIVEEALRMWERDGWDIKWRFGVLVPHADVGPESELRAMAPRDVGIYATRVPFGAMQPGGEMDPTIPLAPVRAFAEPPHVDDATELLAAAPLDAIMFGFTSSAYVTGPDGEKAMLARLQLRARGMPVLGTCASIARALRALGAERVALFDPPWFDAALNALGAGYYRAAGFDVVSSMTCALPSKQDAIEPGALFEFVRQHVSDEAAAVVFGGNGFRVVGAIARLERALERPVVSSNQALLWAAMQAVGAPADARTVYGRLLALS